MRRGLAAFLFLACVTAAFGQKAPKRKIVILLGPPAAGKSTQAAYLEQRYKIPIISAADLARREVGKKGEIRKSLEVGLADGEILSDEILDQLISNRIQQADALNGFVVDGYPRTVAQARYFDAILAERGWGKPKVIQLDASDKTVRERMKKRKRADDKAGLTESLLAAYRKIEADLVGWYAANGGVETLDANRESKHIRAELDRILGPAVE